MDTVREGKFGKNGPQGETVFINGKAYPRCLATTRAGERCKLAARDVSWALRFFGIVGEGHSFRPGDSSRMKTCAWHWRLEKKV